MAARQTRYLVNREAETITCSEYNITSHKAYPAKPFAHPKPSHDLSKDVGTTKERSARSASTLACFKGHEGMLQCQQAMPLSEFVAKHAADLPLRVKVQSGYYGHNSHLTISAGEVLHVYFKKDTTCITVKIGNNNFSIPINSNLQFSILNPANVQEALKGSVYFSVADLLAANPQPQVVCCIENRSRNGLVQEKEVLILAADQGIKTNLKVFSTLTCKDKFLPAELPAVFSTHPDLVSMYLTDLLSLVPCLFPCSTVIANSSVPTALQQVNTLLEKTIESALLCSSDGSNQLFDIPLNIPGVEVTVLPMCSDTEKEQLYSSAQDIIANFNPGTVQVFNDIGSRMDCEIQSFLYSNVRTGFENTGVTLFGSSFISSASKSNCTPSVQSSKVRIVLCMVYLNKPCIGLYFMMRHSFL